MTVTAFALLACQVAVAHEVWIAAHNYTLNAGDEFVADTKIGDDFKGSAQYYIAENTLSAGVMTPTQTLTLDRISGDIPAMKTTVKEDGLHVAWMHTKPNRLHYPKFEKFKKFVTKQGLSEIAEQHLEKGLPTEDFFEAYSRSSKSLIQVGPATGTVGADKAIGLPVELVALDNPYRLGSADGTTLPVQFLWQSKPVPDAQVMIFNKSSVLETTGQPAKALDITTVQTNNEGIAIIPLQSGITLLSALRITTWDGEPEAQWHSYWASLTFSLK